MTSSECVYSSSSFSSRIKSLLFIPICIDVRVEMSKRVCGGIFFKSKHYFHLIFIEIIELIYICQRKNNKEKMKSMKTN